MKFNKNLLLGMLSIVLLMSSTQFGSLLNYLVGAISAIVGAVIIAMLALKADRYDKQDFL